MKYAVNLSTIYSYNMRGGGGRVKLIGEGARENEVGQEGGKV